MKPESTNSMVTNLEDGPIWSPSKESFWHKVMRIIFRKKSYNERVIFNMHDENGELVKAPEGE